jgi:hypothetical protein
MLRVVPDKALSISDFKNGARAVRSTRLEE